MTLERASGPRRPCLFPPLIQGSPMTDAQHPDSALPPMAEHPQAAQRQRVIAELQQVIERVPEQSEFTNTRRYQVFGPLLTLASLGALALGLHQGKTGLLLCGLFLTLLFAVVSWQHRNAGQQVFMRLTRRQLFAEPLSAPVNLTDVVDIQVKDELLQTLQQLTLRADAPLPSHRPVRQLFGNQAVALRDPQPQIRIHSAGLMRAGQKLSVDDISALLDAYCQAANAQQQLDELQGRG